MAVVQRICHIPKPIKLQWLPRYPIEYLIFDFISLTYLVAYVFVGCWLDHDDNCILFVIEFLYEPFLGKWRGIKQELYVYKYEKI